MTDQKDLQTEFELEMRFAEIEWQCLRFIQSIEDKPSDQQYLLIANHKYTELILSMMNALNYEDEIWEIISKEK